jgi:hypothetical protein
MNETLKKQRVLLNKQFRLKVNEAFSSVLPITIIVLILSILWAIHIGPLVMFLVGAALLVVGMGVFTLGVDMSMLPMGEGIGEQLALSKKIWLAAVISFVMGMIITIAEPDLTVLANQVASIPNMIIILTVAFGVGVFMVAAVIRIFFQIPLSRLLIIFYAVVFILSIFVPKAFLAVAFDSGGVTTGPITVPFILSLCVGLASTRGGKSAQDDSFGMVALCSVGPILAVMVLGIMYDPSNPTHDVVKPIDVVTTQDVVREFMYGLPKYFSEVAVAVLPIIMAFVIFQVFSRKYHIRQLQRVAVGFVFTYVGLVLFLTGVNVGFLPLGNLLGQEIAGSAYKWLLPLLGLLIGYFIVMAEPAVHVLNNQVEEVSGGAIRAVAVQRALSIGVAVSVAIAMTRVLTGISIYWFLVPGYLISLILTFFVPPMFTGIAFDSGGVASGPMTSTFLLPFALGAAEASGGNVLTDAFGIVAMVAMTPLVAIQVLGFVYRRNMSVAAQDEAIEVIEMAETVEAEYDDVLELDDSDIEYATKEEIEDIIETDINEKEV